MPKHRILIDEDHSLVADGLRALLGWNGTIFSLTQSTSGLRVCSPRTQFDAIHSGKRDIDERQVGPAFG